ncbi:MAG: CDP-alcohol phosphatidyltransferase family protein [Gemmatimonadetes bacterium]|nr:CDP-alcohol phosphatidyltransferase family protein [Gemmatimonadota bacterium]NNM04206.1 CDP-alcohol phosphatidyltransferase family protein [Gemmatimonadota bacterium]
MRPDLIGLLVALGLCLGSMGIFRLRHDPASQDPLESKQRGTFVLGSFVRSWFYWFIHPLVRLALRARLSPTFFNLLGAGFGAAAGLAFGLGRPVLGGWGIFLGGAADVFDGRIARTRGIASPKGAFLDSSLDRFAEVGVFAGLAVYFQDRPFEVLMVALALGGSLLVSYTRARGESQGIVCKVGIMQRAERLLLLGFAGLLDPSVGQWLGKPPGTLLGWVITVIAVGTLATAVFRTVWIAKRLPNSEPD